MRIEFRTLTRTVSALALALLFVAGGALEALAQGRGRHRGWTQGRHRGWSHSRSRHVRTTDLLTLRRQRRERRRQRRTDWRTLRNHQRQERRALRGTDFDRDDRRELSRHQRMERREFRQRHGRGGRGRH